MNTDIKAIEATLDKYWTLQLRSAAAREGWCLTPASFSPLEVQKIDEPDNWKQHYGFTPPTLDNDNVACVMVRTGTGPHHLIARQLVAAFNEPEFNRWTTLPGVAEHWATPGLGEVVGVSANLKPAAPVMVVGGRYNWRGQPERLVYLGFNWSGNGRWHQFELVDKPGKVWCEVQPDDLAMFEATAPAELTLDDARARIADSTSPCLPELQQRLGGIPVGAGDGDTFVVPETAVVKWPHLPKNMGGPTFHERKQARIDALEVQLDEGYKEAQGSEPDAIDRDNWAGDVSRDPGHAYHAEAVEYLDLKLTPCPDSDNMGIHACGNAGQCFEPCGQLGHDEKHVVPGTPATGAAVMVPLSTLAAWKDQVNTLAVLSLKAERGACGIRLKQAIADVMAGAQPHDEDTRQALGEALTTKLADMCKDGAPDWFDAAHIDEVLDVLMPHIEVLPDSTCETEAQGFAWEAIHQFVPELQCRDDANLVLTPAQAEQLLRRVGWMPPGERREVIEGDVLPPLGSTVYILHGRDDDAHACSVTGYYAWPSRSGSRFDHRVFVTLVYLGTTTSQARHLSDVFETKEAALAHRQANPR